MIMGAIFLPEGLSPLVALISVGNMNDNIIDIWFQVFGMLLVYVIEISCVVSFFMIEKRTSPVPVYLIGLYLMITEGWHIGQMLLYNSGEIGTVVGLSVSFLGKISIAGLLMYQACIMGQKRKRAWKA